MRQGRILDTSNTSDIVTYRSLGEIDRTEGLVAETVGVVGAGFMGSGIAESAARGGYAVALYEPDATALERSRGAIEASLARAVKAGKVEAAEAAAALARIAHTTQLADLVGAQLVIEAVYEDAAVKSEVFRELDRLLPPETPL